MDLLDPLEDYVPPPFSFDIEAATTVYLDAETTAKLKEAL